MKNLLGQLSLVCLAVVVSFCLVGCGDSESSSTPEEQNAEVPTEVEQTNEAPE